MQPDPTAVAAAIVQHDGLDHPETAAAFDALDPEQAIAAAVATRYPQYAARAITHAGERIATALYARAEALGPYDRDTATIIAALLALHRLRGTVLEPRFDRYLAAHIRTDWTASVTKLYREGVATLPHKRREAVVLGDPIAWLHLETLAMTSDMLAKIVAAAATASVPPFPTYHPTLRGLVALGPSVGPAIAQELPAVTSPGARAILVATLAELACGLDALRHACNDSDPLVRRFARHGVHRCGAEVPRLAPAPDRTTQAGRVAESLCRYPPHELDPFRVHGLLHGVVAPELEQAVAATLARCLSPEDAENPLAVYNWLVTREPTIAATCPAIERGLEAQDDRIRALCERVVAGPLPARPWSLAALCEAFDPICRDAELGWFSLLAIDHVARAMIVMIPDHHPAPDLADLATIDPITPATMLDRIAPIIARLVACQDVPPREPSDCGPLDRATAMKRFGDFATDNCLQPVASEEMRRVEAVFAPLGASIAGRELYGIADVAMSHAIVIVDNEGRFSLVIAYLNDQ